MPLTISFVQTAPGPDKVIAQWATDGGVQQNEHTVLVTGVTTAPLSNLLTNIRLLIVGDSSASNLATYLQTARTSLGYSATLTITTQLIGSSYTGANMTTANFDCILVYTNGGLTYNSSLGTNMNAFVQSGGHMITAAFVWGNVSAITNFTYTNCPFQYLGSSPVASISPYTVVVDTTITRGLPTTFTTTSYFQSAGIVAQSGTTVVATYPSGTAFIGTATIGGVRQVGINTYPILNDTNLQKIICNAIYWAVGNI
jgi:hypothetical protein